jgi:ATP-dependent Clp protease ATP-binding subunit ClpA
MTRTGKPIASFLFVGPTGVGKTELAKVLAKFMFGRRNRMIRFDMSEFSQPYSVMRLTGIGRADGLLTSAVRREPFSVLLFDEIEKADGSFYDLLLQILSEGRLTDGQGKLVNFCSAIIIMTSNIGAANLQSNRIGWKKGLDASDVTTHFRSAVEKHFRPELFNRIDQIIPFEPLDEDTIRFVVEREMTLFKKLEGIQFRNLDLEVKEEVLDLLGKKGYDPKYGARKLQRTIREELMTPLSKALNLYDFDDRLTVSISVENEQVKIDLEEDIFGGDLLLEQWDKINFSDKASELRRKIFKLKEGSFYIRLLSKLDVLENEKKRQGEKFWANQQRSAQYSYYLETNSKVKKLTKTIEDYERILALACMNLETYTTDFEERLKTWENDLFNLKVEIYSRLHPNTATAFLSIYGANFEQILDFYLALAEKKDFEISGKTVWFREDYYNEGIMERVLSADEDSQEIVVKKRHEYLKQDWNIQQKHTFKPKEKIDLLIGIELEIKGLCAFPFLKSENGLQQWEVLNEAPSLFDVRITNGRKKAPKGIHRRQYFQKGSPRRFVDLTMVKDPKLRLGHPIPKEGLVEWFYSILEGEFRRGIDEEVV